LPLSTILLFDFEFVSTVWYVLFFTITLVVISFQSMCKLSL